MIPSVVLRAGVLGAAILGGGALCSPASAAGCEAWKGGSEIRCLSQNGDPVSAIAQTVHVQNVSQAAVSFRTEQWDSTCGMPGSSKGAASATLQPGGGMEIEMQTTAIADFLSRGHCTELFVFSCSSGGGGINCSNALSTRMDPPRTDIFGFGFPNPRGLRQ